MKTQPMVVSSRDVQPLKVLGGEVRFLCEGANTKSAWSIMEATLAEGAGPPPHHHAWDEGYFVTAGKVEFIVDGKTFTVAAGDFVYTPGGTSHGFRGVSKEPARLLILDVPAHAETFFKRVDREVKEMPRDLPKVLAIGEDTGIHFGAISSRGS